MLHIGIDEAGYGPLLGPLVIGLTAFRLPEVTEPGRAALRRRLKGLVVKRRRPRSGTGPPLPVPVDDSKAIHRRYGIWGLSRGVGALASALDVAPPADLEDLLLRFSDRAPGDFAAAPWYASLAEATLPSYPWTGPLADRFARRGVQAVGLVVHPLSAQDFNEALDHLGNKARVLGLAAGTALLAFLDRFPGEDAEVVFDRQGARLDYRGYLAGLFPFAGLAIRPAPPGEAAYEIRLPDRRLHVRFATRADAHSLAVGWASMAAKLTRELFMERLNAFFRVKMPALRPTAGYYVDGARFYEEVAPLLEEDGVARALFLRADAPLPHPRT